MGIEVAEAIQPLIVETDCSEVVNQISGKKRSKSELSWILSEVQNQVQRLKEMKVQFTPRMCNGIAHDLAKMALKINEPVKYLSGWAHAHLIFYIFFLN